MRIAGPIEMSIRSFRDLEAWQLGIEFAVRVYRLTKSFPREELYGLTSQLRRSAVAIPSNLSEGHQQGTKAYLHYVVIAIGSLAEADTQLEISNRLCLVQREEIAPVVELATRLRRVLHGLRGALARRTANP
jgi:four helix bundle protein